MADTFDPTALESAKEAMSGYAKEAQKSASYMHDLQVALNALQQGYAKLPELKIVDPDQWKKTREEMTEVTKVLVEHGEEFKEIKNHMRGAKSLISAEVVDMSKLTKEGRKRVEQEAKRLEFGHKIVKYGEHTVELQEGEVKTVKGAVSAFKDKGVAAARYAASLANIQLTLAGIIKIIIDAIDKSNRLGAMSQQVAAQWGDGGDNLRKSAGAIMGIQGGFKKMLDVAGPYVISLSRAGFEKENLLKLSKELMAVEYITGQSVQEQTNYIKGLVANFGLADDEASSYLDIVRETTKTIPMLSMSEAVQDWGELIDKTKAYNTDLLGTLGLYNTLMRKDIAEKLGLGDAPRAVRKEMVKTIAGFSRDLTDGMKAALGEGATVAERILEFESLADKPAEQFERMGKFILEKTAQFTGDTRQIAIRKLLKQFGFTSEEVQKVMAEAFTTGGLNAQGLVQLTREVGKTREESEKARKAAEENRRKIIKRGMAIADGLTGLLHDLQIWIEQLVIKLGNIIDRLDKFLASPLFGGGLGESLGGMARRGLEAGGLAGTFAEQKVITTPVGEKTVTKFREATAGEKLASESFLRVIGGKVGGGGVLGENKFLQDLKRKSSAEYKQLVSDIITRSMETDELAEFIKYMSERNTEAAVAAFKRELKDKSNIIKTMREVISGYRTVGRGRGE